MGGWGLGGYCPGPAVVGLPLMAPGTLAFFPAMLLGILAARLFFSDNSGQSIPSASSQRD